MAYASVKLVINKRSFLQVLYRNHIHVQLMMIWVSKQSNKKIFSISMICMVFLSIKGEDFIIIAGSSAMMSRTELFSLKAGIARRTHDLPAEVSYNHIVQTYHKSSPTTDQCHGEEAGTILNLGGVDKATNLGTDKIWAFSFQHGWLETQATLPASQTSDISALVIP